MDYDFKKNTLEGTYHANFSMGHEALGRWLLEEVGKDFEVIETLFTQINLLKNSANEWTLIGNEMTLILSAEEAVVQENSVLHHSDEEFEEGIDFYNEESISSCGLEDFEQMIESWKAFITRF
ncbi:YacL family protein [Aliivibrio kagoshimensis]|uniref:YacL family protein n=1 Tax=Aliivibrio kagoshimensis TaxID=2910230 RepID=UPI003D0CA94A